MRSTATGMPSMAAAQSQATKHYPTELRYVRALCLQRHYRQCVQACRELLKEPHIQCNSIHTSFLHLYSGISNDEMARSMHYNSTAKVPAFDSAEQSYLAALQALPSPEEAELLCIDLVQEPSPDPFFDPGQQSPNHSYELFDKASVTSSPPRLRRESFSVCSPMTSQDLAASEIDDLESHESWEIESHESFSEIQTPGRVLNRDYSRMSLLNTTSPAKRYSRDISSYPPQGPPAPKRMERDYSRMSLLQTPPRIPMSQGLLHPIRLGSPAAQFHIPPKFANTSRLPVSKAGKKQETADSSPRHAMMRNRDSFFETQYSPEVVSPISRLGSGQSSSDVSTISAVSPLTPTRAHSGSFSSGNDNEGLVLRFNDHLDSMRMQLETHLTLVQQAKEQLQDARAERASTRAGRVKTGPVGNLTEVFERARDASATSNTLPQSRSYWSLVPEDAKAAERQRRIKDIRARRGERKTERFDPRKYQDLCERALAELCLAPIKP